ncbi:MAG: chemotaxis protein CheC [Planctomycetaceae bacterium]|nr:chemotaxis protein CheC [Planctomycetaceae bacterium]
MSESAVSEPFSEDQLDLLQELVNIGVGRAADALNQLVEAHIQLCVPGIKVLGSDDAHKIFINQAVMEDLMVSQSFKGSVAGRVGLLFNLQSAFLLASMLADDEDLGDKMSPEHETILLEVGNILLNSVMGSISNAIEDQLIYTVPDITHSDSINMLLAENMLNKPTVILVDVCLQVEGSLIEGSIIVVFDAGEIIVALDRMLTQV